MKIIVKGIRGGSCVVDVTESTSIIELKRQVEASINILAIQQTLVLAGKTLQDDKNVGDYPTIKEGTKLYVAVKKVDTLNSALSRYLRAFYSDQQCSIIVDEFMKDFQSKVSNLSLDDLERIAKADMNSASS